MLKQLLALAQQLCSPQTPGTLLLAALFPVPTFFLLTSLLSARQQKELTVVPLACRLEQFPASFDLI